MFTWFHVPDRPILLVGKAAGSGRAKLEQAPVISIVDDDESMREATKSLVQSLGYRALAFSSAEEFLGSTQLTGTACLITDVQMPGLNGVQLQDRLRAVGHPIPMIFISAFPDEGQKRQVLASGAIGYLPKPFKEDQLIDCIDAALKHQGGRRVEL